MSDNRLLVLPKLGLTMTEGAIAEWVLAPGESFKAGDVIFIVESDKAAVEFEAPSTGVLQEIIVEAGKTVPVGTEIGRWLLEGSTSTDPQAAPKAPVVAENADRRPDVASTKSEPTATQVTNRVVATPLARRLANQAAVDLSQVSGSGPRGRIQAADVTAHIEHNVPSAPSSTYQLPTAGQRTMATRMTAAKQEIPHFYLSVDAEVSELIEFRSTLADLPGRPRVSMTHLLVAGVVDALQHVPDMNRIWTEEGYLSFDTIDVGLAINTSSGLVSAVARDLGPKSFYEKVRCIDELIQRARAGKLRPDDVRGGAITISNAGMHDVRYMSSIIVPGQSSILGVGAIQECFRPDENGNPQLRRELGMVLSADHRIHTGVSALDFLNQLKMSLRQPVALLAGM